MKSTIAPAEDTPVEAPVADGDDTTASTSSDQPGRTPRQLVKLSIIIDEAEFDRDIEQAFRKIGREARLPGFRAGKVPRKVLEARIGIAAARDERIREYRDGKRDIVGTTVYRLDKEKPVETLAADKRPLPTTGAVFCERLDSLRLDQLIGEQA